MVISAIKRQLGNSNRASIFLDDKYAFSLTVNQLIEQKLKVGIDISRERLIDLEKLSIKGKIYAQAIDWLNIRPRSEHELRDYLIKKKLEPDFIDSLVQELQKSGAQSDSKYAFWLFNSRNKRLKSNLYIAKELKSKGIDDETIKSVLTHEVNDQLDKLRSLIQKKRKLQRYQDENRLKRYLTQLGYSFSDVKAVLAEE